MNRRFSVLQLRSRKWLDRLALTGAAVVSTQCEPSSTIHVTNASDGAEGSLRSAISAANSGTIAARIELPPGTYELTRCGASDDANASGDLDFTRAASLTIAAPNGGVVIRQTCSGERVLDVLGAGLLTLSNVQITGGTLVANSAGDAAQGGGVRALGNVILQGATITGNSARAAAGSAAPAGENAVHGGAARGGGLFVGGALSADSLSTLSLNTATISCSEIRCCRVYPCRSRRASAAVGQSLSICKRPSST